MISIIEQVMLIIKNDGLTQAEVSRQSGVSQSILSPLIKGTYKGNSEANMQQLQNWLNTYANNKAAKVELPTLNKPSFVKLPLASRFLGLMSMAQSEKFFTMVYEGSGVGKTMTAAHYASTNSNVWIITASDNIKSKKAFFSALARAMNIDTTGLTIDRIDYAIGQKITGSHGLIIIDEAQYVTDANLNALRILADNKVGVTLLGNDVVRTRMSAVRHRADMNPFWSRVMMPLKVTSTPKADIKAYLYAWGVNPEINPQYQKVIDWACTNIPNTRGQLRTLSLIMSMAVRMAQGRNECLGVEHLEPVYKTMSAVAER
ncbi:AAA family ATPase [Shewanella halifaxensis]|uniref:AAA family ATPase n=1 Tax=Shewanella halifaxensis TaxID=271098 RepID=UPI000D5956C6|nr:AAA family ATPase [Shewanella halifaxensis]